MCRPRGVDHQLGVDVLRAAEDGEPRTLLGAEDPLPDPALPVLSRGFPLVFLAHGCSDPRRKELRVVRLLAAAFPTFLISRSPRYRIPLFL